MLECVVLFWIALYDGRMGERMWEFLEISVLTSLPVLCMQPKGWDISFASKSLPTPSIAWPRFYIHWLSHQTFYSCILSPTPPLSIHLFTGPSIHPFLKKLSHGLHGAGHMVSIQDMERITQTLHASCLQTSRENSQGNVALSILMQVLWKCAKVAMQTPWSITLTHVGQHARWPLIWVSEKQEAKGA